jgi:pimeloyl-ACP methyl ester carboxylesterase
MAADVRRLMDEQWIHEAYLIGHSMGGKVAMRLALDEPDRIRKLIVVDIAPKAYDRKHDTIIDAMLKLDPRSASSRDDLDRALAHDIPEKAIRLFLLKNIKRNKDGGYTWQSNLSSIAKNYDRILEEVRGEPYRGPACFIRGENSPYILAEDENPVRGIFPPARFVTIKGAGHWVHAEAPELFLENTRQFLASDG